MVVPGESSPSKAVGFVFINLRSPADRLTMKEPLAQNRSSVVVADPSGDTDIDQLLRARSEIDSALRRHKSQFTVFFTDIVGSTAFFEQHGDTAGLVMLQLHNELVIPPIETCGGTVIKTIGDAVMAVFSSPVRAVRAAMQVQQQIDAHNQDQPRSDQLYTRIGLNFGRGFVKNKDVFGDVVNTAARIVKACAPAQILFSRSVYEALQKEKGFKYRKLRSAAFHGKAAPEALYEVLWTSPQRYQQLRRQFDHTEDGKTTRNLLGRYEILQELGRGAMGVIYKAYDPTVGRIVALKTVRLDVTDSDREELVQRLRQEAQAIGRLEHPNIVTLYDAGEAEGLFYLTMQFVNGRTLAQLFSERTLLPVEQVVLLLEQVCEGLDCAHQRSIVHRDMKPSNIIVTREGVAKIVDFGVAKLSEGGLTKAGMLLGTPSYMSPEQAQGGRVDRRSDIFSLGAILYELLTGEKAFPGRTPTAIIHKILYGDPIPVRVVEPGIEPALEKIVRKALAKDPFRRYQSCRQMQEELHAFRTSQKKGAKGSAHLAGANVSAPANASHLNGGQRAQDGEQRAEVRASVKARVAAPAPLPAHSRGRRVAAAVVAFFLWAGIGVYSWRQGWLSPETLDTFRALVSQPEEIPSIVAGLYTHTLASLGLPPAVERNQAVPQPEAENSAAEETVAVEENATAVEQAAEEGNAAATVESAAAPEDGADPILSAKVPPAQEAQPETAQAAPPPPARSRPQPARRTRKQQEIQKWFRQADQYVQKGTYWQADFALRQVLRLDPNNQRALSYREKLRRLQEQRQRENSSGQ